MASKPNEPNRFIKLKKDIISLPKDISFLKTCRRLGLNPVNNRVTFDKRIPFTLVKKWERDLLQFKIRGLYAKLTSLTLECYALHIKLSNEYPLEFPLFLTKVKVAQSCEAKRKGKLLSKKLKKLKLLKFPQGIRKITKVENLEGFIVNRSSENFSNDQLNLLQLGLNFAINSHPNMDQLIIDAESAIKSSKLSAFQKDIGRGEEADALKVGFPENHFHQKEVIVAWELQEKPVFYLKADNGNSVFIVDKSDTG